LSYAGEWLVFAVFLIGPGRLLRLLWRQRFHAHPVGRGKGAAHVIYGSLPARRFANLTGPVRNHLVGGTPSRSPATDLVQPLAQP
jgi:hypothetical protein